MKKHGLVPLVSLCLVLLIASGCEVRIGGNNGRTPVVSGSYSSTTESFTWQGKTVEIVLVNTGSSSSSRQQADDRIELRLNEHVVIITPKEISLDGVKKTAESYSKVTVRGEGRQLRVLIDGNPLLP